MQKHEDSAPQEPAKPLNAAERADLERLRAENAELRMQVEFAKRVATWFAKGKAVKFAVIADWADRDNESFVDFQFIPVCFYRVSPYVEWEASEILVRRSQTE